MNITVGIMSRARSLALTGVIMSLHRLRSGQHSLNFIVGSDTDDMATMNAVFALEAEPGLDVQLDANTRPDARGTIENRVLSHCTDADAVTLLTDRTFPITPGWDDILARGVAEAPKRLLWWSCPDDPGCVMPVIPKAWLAACSYKWSPEIFPFWFDDTWNQQIDLMIHGLPSQKVRAAYSGSRGRTTRAREIAFWLQVFRATFPQRAQAAKTMSEAMGLPWTPRDDVSVYFERWEKDMASRAESMEAAYGDPSPPGPEYLAAKERAMKFVQAMEQAAA